MSDVRVGIHLPLPLDVSATITRLFGLAYPNAMIDFAGGHPSDLTIRIPEGDRTAVVDFTDEEAQEAVVQPTEFEGDLHSMTLDETGTPSVKVLPPEELAATLVGSMRAAFEANPFAENYLEWTMTDRVDPTQRFVAIACKSADQTPHALRRKAEKERDEALAQVDELKAIIARLTKRQQ